MRVAKGFKGRYFTLAAIQALNSQIALHADSARYRSLFVVYRLYGEEPEEDPPEEPPLVSCTQRAGKNSSKPCHCNCFFRRRAWLLFHLSKFFRRSVCRCRKTKTGLAPPLFTQLLPCKS